MKLVDYLLVESIAAGADVSGKSAVLDEVARLARMNPSLGDVEEAAIVEGLRQREELGSTGFGEGIAIPHCRLGGISEFVMGIMTVPGGVDYESMDGGPVRLVVFVIAPESEANAYIKLLSLISRTLKIPGAVEEIVSQGSPGTIRESFLRHSGDKLDTKGHANRQLFHVVIQDEDIFREVLEVFEATATSSVIVIEARNIREYLVTMPLFASLWSDSHLGNSRIILAAVDSSVTNRTIRAIENITGNLDKRNGVLLTVQDILYAAGSLDI